MSKMHNRLRAFDKAKRFDQRSCGPPLLPPVDNFRDCLEQADALRRLTRLLHSNGQQDFLAKNEFVQEVQKLVQLSEHLLVPFYERLEDFLCVAVDRGRSHNWIAENLPLVSRTLGGFLA